MSILINGMEMPKSCIGCLFGSIESCDETEPLKICCTIHGVFTHEVDWHEVCPLVEVPTPHGRLIDADALLESIKEAKKKQPEISDVYDEDYFAVAEWVAYAPTIIESEEA